MAKKRPTLDLHGAVQDEVFPLLDRFIMKHSRASEMKHSRASEVLVIVGKGGRGVVRQKTLEWLKRACYPYRYEKVRGVENRGAIIVDI